MTQVMQPRIRYDPSRVAHLDPKPPQVTCTQRSVSLVARKHPLPGRGPGEAVQQLPRRLAEQNVPRSRLRVNQGEPVGLDLAPVQATYLARPAPRQKEQAHRRDACRAFRFPLAQDRAELRQIVRAEQPPARRTPVADDAGARVPRRLLGDSPMQWRSRTCCAVCHGARDSSRGAGIVWQYLRPPVDGCAAVNHGPLAVIFGSGPKFAPVVPDGPPQRVESCLGFRELENVGAPPVMIHRHWGTALARRPRFQSWRRRRVAAHAAVCRRCAAVNHAPQVALSAAGN